MILVFTVVIVGFITSRRAEGGVYVETFDSGVAGWQYGYGPHYHVGSTFLENTGGNTGAHISGVADNLYAIWIDNWGLTPSLVPYGNMNGLMMSMDTKVTGATTGVAQFYVGKDGDYFVADGWDISLDTEWTTHTAILDESVFQVWGSHSVALSDILAAPDDVGIFFGASTVAASSSARISVDNFGVVTPTSTSAVPEPSSLFYMVGCSVLLLFRRVLKTG